MHASTCQKQVVNWVIYSWTGDGLVTRVDNVKVSFTDVEGTFDHKTLDLENAIRQLVLSARNSVKLLSYSLPSYDDNWFLHNALDTAAKKGVRIKFYGDRETEIRTAVSRLSHINPKTEGWYWVQDGRDLFHIKAIVVDDTRLYLGSANLSKNAITASAEWGIICESPDIIQRLRAYLDHLIERGRLKEVEVDVR